MTAVSNSDGSTGYRPRWPLFVAPIVCLLYYAAFDSAFATALRDVVANTYDLDRIGDIAHPVWGSHWFYRIFAEVISVLFGTFVAGGMAREQATMAAMVGGFGISLYYTARVAVVAFSQIIPEQQFTLREPSYQYAIDAILIVVAPVLGHLIGEATKRLSTSKPTGFAGVARLHIIWLWFPAYWYAVALIAPIIHYFVGGLIDNKSNDIVTNVANFFPLIAYGFPLFMGLTLLAEPSNLRPLTRQVLGGIVLIVGWIIAAVLQYGLITIVNKIHGF